MNDIHPAIAAKLAELDQERDSVLAAAPAMAFLGRAVAECGHLFTSSSLRMGNRGEPWLSATFDSAADVVAMRRWFAANGCRLLDFHEFPEDNRQVHGLTCSDGSRVALNVRFMRTGAACTYVRTGTKEVPVYELNCEGASA